MRGSWSPGGVSGAGRYRRAVDSVAEAPLHQLLPVSNTTIHDY
jgi:hypothetical protein